ncbi:hypothetical protein DICVIV_06094 [Dictyocaulus viviparus]|uniref:Uncharacterized protein n=1 Tax=Dictyocaulus viviparus TaxID=29172 RepID=A0A0D8XVG5_DICVI|nr:hypothetical protein DICVIV_06094 [Dictyocaulus viviparus]
MGGKMCDPFDLGKNKLIGEVLIGTCNVTLTVVPKKTTNKSISKQEEYSKYKNLTSIDINTQPVQVKRHYDDVQFGRSDLNKKASYDYIRFGKRNENAMMI